MAYWNKLDQLIFYFEKNVAAPSCWPKMHRPPSLNQISPVFPKFGFCTLLPCLLQIKSYSIELHKKKTHWWKFWELESHKMFLHWKGEVRLSPAYHVIRPEKSSANFNSKFYANLDFKEFELQFLNLQQVYVPCEIRGEFELSFQRNMYQSFC